MTGRRAVCATLLSGLLLAALGCAHTVPNLPKDFHPSTPEALTRAESLRETVQRIVDGGGNLGRLKAIQRRLGEMDLSDLSRTEPIDWFSLQKNIVVEIEGKSSAPKLVYIVAHYDKMDMNLLKFISVLLNGALDDFIGWSFLSDGATDNASGVAVALELARAIRTAKLRCTYRILMTGSEESGLRGSRAHVARIRDEDWRRLMMAVNLDVVGVKDRPNCIMTDVTDPKLVTAARTAASRAGVPLREGRIPLGAGGDYQPFRATSFWRDLLIGIQANLVGGFLPQRSWFVGRHSVPIISYNVCDPIDASDYISGLTSLPVGRLHGPRDRAAMVDPIRLHEQFEAVWEFIRTLDQEE